MQRLWNFVLVTAFAAAPHAGIAGASLSGTLSREDIALIDRVTWGVNRTSRTEFARWVAKAGLMRQFHPPPKAGFRPPLRL